MSRKPKKRRKENPRKPWEAPILYDRRAAFAKVIAADIHAGEGWEHDHESGTQVVWQNRVGLRDGGTVAYPWPQASELLLRIAEPRLERAALLRNKALEGASDGGELYPEHKTVNDHNLIFEFFQEAMAGVVLVYAALNNFANEQIPKDFSLSWKGADRDRDYFIARGIELRLSKVLHEATGKPNLLTDRIDIWEVILHLKALRDDIEHANGGIEAFKPGIDMDSTIFARLMNEPRLAEFVSQVRQVIDMYRDGDQGPRTLDSGGHIVELVSARRFAEGYGQRKTS